MAQIRRYLGQRSIWEQIALNWVLFLLLSVLLVGVVVNAYTSYRNDTTIQDQRYESCVQQRALLTWMTGLVNRPESEVRASLVAAGLKPDQIDAYMAKYREQIADANETKPPVQNCENLTKLD